MASNALTPGVHLARARSVLDALESYSSRVVAETSSTMRAASSARPDARSLAAELDAAIGAASARWGGDVVTTMTTAHVHPPFTSSRAGAGAGVPTLGPGPPLGATAVARGLTPGVGVGGGGGGGGGGGSGWAPPAAMDALEVERARTRAAEARAMQLRAALVAAGEGGGGG